MSNLRFVALTLNWLLNW